MAGTALGLGPGTEMCMSDTTTAPYMSLEEVTSLLRRTCPRATRRMMRRLGGPEARKVGGRLLYRTVDVMAFAESDVEANVLIPRGAPTTVRRARGPQTRRRQDAA